MQARGDNERALAIVVHNNIIDSHPFSLNIIRVSYSRSAASENVKNMPRFVPICQTGVASKKNFSRGHTFPIPGADVNNTGTRCYAHISEVVVLRRPFVADINEINTVRERSDQPRLNWRLTALWRAAAHSPDDDREPTFLGQQRPKGLEDLVQQTSATDDDTTVMLVDPIKVDFKSMHTPNIGLAPDHPMNCSNREIVANVGHGRIKLQNL